MSLKRETECRCPFCHEKQDIILWDYLNTNDSPEMKPLVMSGDVFNVPCKKCGRSARIGYPMLYQDPERRLLVGMLPEKSPQTATALVDRLRDTDLVGPKMRGYTVRGVMQPPELSEKITIAEHGLDDRAVELYKLLVREHFSEKLGGKSERIYLHEEEGLHFLLINDETDEIYFADFIQDTYEDVVNKFQPFFPQGTLNNIFVDREWVENVLKPSGQAH